MEREHDTASSTQIRWLSLAAAATALIAAAAMVSLNALAETGDEGAAGFEPGARTFNNPFANTPPPPPEADDIGSEEDFAGEPPPPPPAPEPPRYTPPSRGGGGARAGGGTSDPAKDVPEPQKTEKGVAVGGNPPSGVITHKEVDPLELDSETGFGASEVVTDFNYPDVDILDLAKTMGKLTGKNFIFDKDVKGRVSIVSNSPISVGDAWRAFLTALDMNTFTLIPSGRYIRIARQRDARDKQISTYTGDSGPDTDALITRVFSLKYIGAEEIARTFRSFMPANSRIIPHQQTNTVIVTDTGSNISKLAKMLEFLDVEGFDAGIEVVPVKYASAVELAKLIDTLLPGTTAGVKPGGGGARLGGSQFQARRTKEGGIINTIISDERTNTLIVHANSKGADEVRALVAKLDRKLPSTAGGGKIHVVYLQYGDAEKIATTLNNLSSQSGSGGGSAGKPGLGTNPTNQALFEGSIKVSADKSTNSLVITASPSDFSVLQRVIGRLDIPLDQVYVEAVIMEMSMGKDFSYSSNVALPNADGALLLAPNNDLVATLANPLAQRGLVIPMPLGKETTVTINGQSKKVSSVLGLIKALQTNSNANVLATPQILTLDNTEASFESAERIPVPNNTISQTGQVSAGFNKERVGLSIKIKPQINKVSDFVKLDIETTLEDFSGRQLPSAVEQFALATSERTAKTSVVIGDKDTVVLGGLVRDKRTDTVSKVPILGDIPLLGWLFRSKTSAMEKTNLIVFITPHIIREYEKMRALLDRNLQQRDQFIESATGGEDNLREYRDEMIRGLPPIEEIMGYKERKSVTQ
ncbi:MAG: type II secretion system secretin GspD [Bdellovibrionales bacterium]|nr:type II secretion system secretin GspD [Bdellovibrionales bacterium]